MLGLPAFSGAYEFGQLGTGLSRFALSKLLKREGRAGAEGAILPYVGHLQLISTLKIGDDVVSYANTS